MHSYYLSPPSTFFVQSIDHTVWLTGKIVNIIFTENSRAGKREKTLHTAWQHYPNMAG